MGIFTRKLSYRKDDRAMRHILWTEIGSLGTLLIAAKKTKRWSYWNIQDSN